MGAGFACSAAFSSACSLRRRGFSLRSLHLAERSEVCLHRGFPTELRRILDQELREADLVHGVCQRNLGRRQHA